MSAWELDCWVRRSERGRLLAGGAPARLLRLSEAGAAVLDRALQGETTGAAETALLERLRDAGLLHPIPVRASAVPLTTVIPVRNGGDPLPALIAAARRWGEVIVVDDRSTDGSAGRAEAAGARVIANPGPPGPAAARNAGLRAAETELVAFVDADCEADRVSPASAVVLSSAMRSKGQPHSARRAAGWDWAPRLAALLEDDTGLALAAPRVRSVPGAGAVAHYETACSPLDMGGSPGLVGPGRRLGYVPSTAFVARRVALLALGGFDETLRFGEDVDLVWRLVAAGHRVRYAPQVEVQHRPRPTVAALARQRFEYGRSAATLDRLHPGEAAPLRLDRYSAATIAAGAALGWRAAATTAALGAARIARRGTDPPSRRALATVAARGQLQTARQLSRALLRDWLLLTALACAVSPRARRIAAAAAAIDLIPILAPTAGAAVPALALRPLDHAAYAAGLWAGAARARSPGALLPRRPRQASRLIFTAR